MRMLRRTRTWLDRILLAYIRILLKIPYFHVMGLLFRYSGVATRVIDILLACGTYM
ncbi:hypothetical protein AG1IA_03529 [Rhizoctonia solani AG-1 IA]|uniref:Uncharacterized protein n=1 Tax=Thanatephorus cucumeris (strain AG1-IA) TaxID=983506 RepID=L8WWS4_THACA|nr:hypothetical protein AG1IA_03529 [Rhizoctonia solani AG-1 IA]